MSTRPLGTVVLLMLFAAAGARAQESDTRAARTAVEGWLAVIDAQHYEASWEAAAEPFRTAVTLERWTAAARAAREPLGAVQSRTLASTKAAKTLPGAPDGEYVVVQFTTRFEHKAEATETVTAVHESDGAWRVVGYFIR